jgi:colanic acid/amylovoran biosynthesis glycosyltransferase
MRSAGSNRYRIGYVLSLFPCYDETFILREMKALREKQVDIHIFSLRRRSQAVTQEEALPLASRTYYAGYFSPNVMRALARAVIRRPLALSRLKWSLILDLWRRPLTLIKSLAFIPKATYFAEIAAREAVTRIHAHWATFPATTALLMSRMTGIPWSFTCHAHDIFFDPILLRDKLEDAEFVLTCTADNKRYLETVHEAAAAKVRVSYHGLDLEQFHPPRERSQGSQFEILSVGSLLECKGFHHLIEACRLLDDRGLTFRLTIAGGGPEEQRLRSQASRAGIGEKVRFTGFVTQRQLVPLYQKADVFVLPAVLEIHWGIPNVLVEALACSTPVITTPLPSINELVEDGVHGILTRDGDPVDLADNIMHMAQNPERRLEMGRMGRRRAEERFDIRKTVESVIEPMLGIRTLPQRDRDTEGKRV